VGSCWLELETLHEFDSVLLQISVPLNMHIWTSFELAIVTLAVEER